MNLHPRIPRPSSLALVSLFKYNADHPRKVSSYWLLKNQQKMILNYLHDSLWCLISLDLQKQLHFVDSDDIYFGQIATLQFAAVVTIVPQTLRE